MCSLFLKDPKEEGRELLTTALDQKADRMRLKAFLKEITEGYLEEMAGEKQVVMKMKELWSYLSLGLGIDKKQLKAIHKATHLSEYKSAVQMILY